MLNEKKITIRRKNVFLDVSPAALDSYLAKGYTRVDANGNPIIEPTKEALEIEKIRKECNEKVKKLEDRIKELESQLAETIKLKSVELASTEETPTKATGRKSKK